MLFYPVVRWSINNIIIRNKYLYWFSFYVVLPSILVSLHQVLAAIVITVILNYRELGELIINRLFNSQWVWVDLVLYFIMTVALNIFKLQNKSKDITLRNSNLQTQLYNSQFDVLKNQIHPHFLFNTLNTLTTLILQKNRNEAVRVLGLVSSFLKKTVYENPDTKIKLSEEMEFINNYLEIEMIRFRDKIEIRNNVSESAGLLLVPNFILQPIVENAIHHAVAPQKSKGIIAVTAFDKNNYLHIIIEDNGPGIQKDETKNSGKGLGLRITKERLLHAYTGKSELKYGESELGGLRIEIKIPVEFGINGSKNKAI